MTNPMTEARLFELIEIWGAEPSCWPEGEQAAARALLKAAPEKFEIVLRDARALDGLLGAVPEVVPSPMLTEAIMASAPRAAKARVGWFRLKAPWMPVSGMAAATFGLLMGLTVAPAASASDDLDAEVQELVISALGFDASGYVEDVE